MRCEVARAVKFQGPLADVVLVSERLSPCAKATAKPKADLEFNSTSWLST